MEKVLVNTVVKNAIKNIKTDPERTARNLVDMASRFADTRFQKQFYGTIQSMLQNENSAYYSLVRDTLSAVYEETLLTFGMNLGYNGLYLGAENIRKQEESLGYSIPWNISFSIQDERVYDYHHKVIDQGEKLGIHSWYLFSDHGIHACFDIAARHPDSAFVIFCGTQEIDLTVPDYASECRNLALVIPFDKDADLICELLRLSGILYGLYYTYQESDLPAIESGALLEEMEQLNPAVCFFKPKILHQLSLRQQVYQWIAKARTQQKYSAIPFDLYEDVKMVDHVISEDPIWVGFDAYGQLNTELGADHTHGLNIFHKDLPEILEQAFPKRKKSGTRWEEE